MSERSRENERTCESEWKVGWRDGEQVKLRCLVVACMCTVFPKACSHVLSRVHAHTLLSRGLRCRPSVRVRVVLFYTFADAN